MNKILVLITFLVISVQINGQAISESDILGSWKVQRVTQKPSGPDIIPILDGFKKGIFTFYKSGKFGFNTTSNEKEFLELIDMFDNTGWKLEKDQQLIRIGAEEDEYSILGIYVNKSNGILNFHIDESGLKFEMSKVK